MPERTPGSGSRGPTLQGCTRACASQHIVCVTVLHRKDLVQGFWQKHSPFSAARELPFIMNRGERPGRPLTSASTYLCIQANARADRPHMQAHMQVADPGSRRGDALGQPAGNYLCVARTIRLKHAGIRQKRRIRRGLLKVARRAPARMHTGNAQEDRQTRS
jgi:hypothetical protein